MSPHVLDPASEAEAEMAATARACIVAALDHSKAERIKVTINTGAGDSAIPELILPPRALRFFADVLRQMAKREPMMLVPQKCELTTQEAAAFLNVSRPFVIKEIEAGRLMHRMVGTHRRIRFADLIDYAKAIRAKQQEALDKKADNARELGLEY
jgi:excisionase family DNA binding protein